MYHCFLIHSSADGHLGCFHVLAIINSAAMNIGVHMSLSDLVSSVCMPRNGIAGSIGEGEGGMIWENSIKTCVLSSVEQIASPGWMHETSAWGWCTGMTQRDGMGKEVGGGSGWGTHVNPWLIHVNVWQKPLQYCKVISLQLIKIIEEKKKRSSCFYNEWSLADLKVAWITGIRLPFVGGEEDRVEGGKDHLPLDGAAEAVVPQGKPCFN